MAATVRSLVTWRVVSVGKPKLRYAQLGIADYEGRIRRFAQWEWRTVPAATPERESAQLVEASRETFRLLLDSRGREFPSLTFAENVSRWIETPKMTVSLLVGGAAGVTEAVRRQANLLWSLGPHTLQHELALLVALEQVYRAHTIIAHLPYHRE